VDDADEDRVADLTGDVSGTLYAPSTSDYMVRFARIMRGVAIKYGGRRMDYETAAALHDEMQSAVEAFGGIEHMGPTISHGLVSELEDLLAVEGILDDDGQRTYILTAMRLANDTADEIQAHLRRCGLSSQAAMVDVAEVAPLSGTVINVPSGQGFTSDGTHFITTNYSFTIDVAQGASTSIGGMIVDESSDWDPQPKDERGPTLSEVWRD
jgi:hypothetical protein